MINKEVFAERLKEMMFYADNITPVELAKKLGLGRDAINSYLRGSNLPYAGTLLKLSDYFNCSADYLLGVKDDSSDTFKTTTSITEALNKAITESKFSKYRIQKDCEIRQSDMDYWLKGKGYPTAYSLVKLSKYLDISVDALLGREQ